MQYATPDDINERLTNELTDEQKSVCSRLLEDAAIIIDAYNKNADLDAKRVVSVRMVVRAIGDTSSAGLPVGATQGTMAALGYSQSWTMSGGAIGELYLAKLDKKLLGIADRIGSASPVECLGVTNIYD